MIACRTLASPAAPRRRARSLRTVLALAGASLVLATGAAAQDAPLARGVRAFEQRRYAEARGPLLEAARAKPADPRAALYLGRIELLEGDASAAVEWLERAAAAAPRDADAHRWLGRAYARQARRANRLRQVRLAGKVRGAFETAVRLAPSNVDARRDLLQFYLVAPAIVGGGTDKARGQAREIARLSAMYGRLAAGWISEADGDAAAARREYEAAAAAFPDSAAPLVSLAGLHQRAKAWGEAIATFERVLAKHADHGEALYGIGRTAGMGGVHLARGAAALERFIARPPGENEPSLATAHLRLATIRERMGEHDAARRHYAEALRLDPELDDAKAGLKRVRA